MKYQSCSKSAEKLFNANPDKYVFIYLRDYRGTLFYVLSLRHRKGIDANLTLGNRKAVDILAMNQHDVTITIDVKGLAGKTGWPVDNVKEANAKPNHFLVFVCFMNKINDWQSLPEVYIVPSQEVGSLIYQAPGGRRLIQLSALQRQRSQYQNAWQLITSLSTAKG